MSRAVIVGSGGQDGRLLWEQLRERQFSLVGLTRGDVRCHQSRWDAGPVDVLDAAAVRALVDAFQPDQVYYLAAHHHSSQDDRPSEAALWRASWQTHVTGFENFLAAVQQARAPARVFYASSSRIFGEATASPQNEATPFKPSCVYGATKAAAMMVASYYRRAHGVYVSSGILFNHESPLRGAQFVSQRVVDGLVALKLGRSQHLAIGDLDARVDWGYAPDYTRAMQLILAADAPEDFVVASGETHSIRELIALAAEVLGVEWEGRVIENKGILQRGSQELCGDAARLRTVTGWRPSVSFAAMIRILAEAALARQRTAA
jgi:GDPmannose 4,6-dehydratase